MPEPVTGESIDALTEEFLARYRRGERPAISEYAERCPDLADEIRALFPTLVIMEQAGAPATSEAGAASAALSNFQCPERLGEYRILREIGRGGMGVVFEAEQESLARRVALKVFPFHALMDARHLSRFQREARAAAQLHHSHIVPVFGVGQAEGVYFYAMQYIDGKGIDAVLEQMIRWRTARGGDSESRGEVHGAQPDGDTGCAAEATVRQTESGASLWSADRGTYHRRVARLGEQAAEALAYAHGQGIVHRDVKPSNLILDQFGDVWITDFGLAKFSEYDDVTQSRDVVGTLRYMAPEQLHGWADPRTDIHALGLTLFELLTMRPALDAPDRARLIKQISEAPTPTLRRIEPRVPRDLETIVHKATAKEPAERYNTAAEMAADLRRFLADQPIHARRVSMAGRAWRWCRRNPTLAAVSALLLLAVAIFVPVQWNTNRQLTAQLEALALAEAGERTQLRESLLAQARAQLSSRQPGQRFGVIETLIRAARIRAGADLRDVAATAMSMPDLRIAARWKIKLEDPQRDAPAFDAMFIRCAVPLAGGGFAICSAETGQTLTTFEDDGRGPARGFRFSEDGRFLAVSYRSGGAAVWNLETSKPVAEYAKGGVSVNFDSRKPRVAVTRSGSGVLIQPLGGGGPQRLPVEDPVYQARFDPEGRRVAVRRPTAVEVWTLDGPRRDWSVTLGAQPWDVEWTADGRRLAVSTRTENSVRVLDAQDGRELHVLRGHDDLPNNLVFHPGGRWLVSAGWDRTLRVWDTYRGVEVLVTPAMPNVLRFSADGTKLGFTPDAETMAIAEWGSDTAFREFAPGSTREAFPYSITSSTDGRLLVTTGQQGAHVWDTDSGVERRFIPLVSKSWLSAAFETSGALLLSAGGEGIYRVDPHGSDAPKLLDGTVGYQLQSIMFDGTTWVVEQLEPKEGQLWPAGDRSRAITFARGHKFTGILVSPDRRFAVSNLWPTGDIRVWDAARATSDRTLGLGRNAEIHYTPDGRWLITGSNVEYRVWEMGTWQPGPAWAADMPGRSGGAIAVSQDGAWMATLHGGATFSVRDTRKWQEHLRLIPPFPFQATMAHLSRDGSRLWMLGHGHRVAEWRLDRLRAELIQAQITP